MNTQALRIVALYALRAATVTGPFAGEARALSDAYMRECTMGERDDAVTAIKTLNTVAMFANAATARLSPFAAAFDQGGVYLTGRG